MGMYDFVEQRKVVYLRTDINCFVTDDRGAFSQDADFVIKAGSKGEIFEIYTEGDEWEEQTHYYNVWIEDANDTVMVEVNRLWQEFSEDPIVV